ncbi:tetratricopeptide repeat protein [Lampropedia aestuarii]|uniref:Tetratricopeptide repeat protein n=1 Tax=Lampropedia aestuarii TaxID=2562762 RepID=A0A4S5BGZ3_9BURK|nr:tetratricopeptide repeat protein [Lampropedia aestuarii]MDH5858598.1 tetratricopeptide repeat protein [Lampropedia aestuarii]THJ31637.1 tetratricopeptide repeat protein [Lampropedia aestuarii]
MYTLRSLFSFGHSPLSHYIGAASTALCIALAALGNASAQTNSHTQIQALLQSGQAQQALVQAEQALEKTPRDPQLQFLKANAEQALGQTEAADASLTALTQNFPELPEPWNNLAQLRAAQGRLAEAQQLLEKALISNPQFAKAHANLAQVLLAQTIGHLEQAQQIAPNAQQAAQIQALRAASSAQASPAGEATIVN